MFKDALDMPWKVRNRVGSLFSYPIVRLKFLLSGIKWGSGWSFFGSPIIQKHRRSEMTFGSGLQLRSRRKSNPLGVNHPVILATLNPGARLIIGERFAMSGGSICVAEKVTIGNGVAIGANSTIVDTDFHPLSPGQRTLHPQDGETGPVAVEDDVFIGTNCLILKGVTIGRGSVVGANSVVAKSVPPGVIVAGNPARVIKPL